MTTRTMWDGIDTDAAGIARLSPQMVAYYVDGRFAWSQAEIALFPHASHVTISALGGDTAADVVDCEAGDTTPDSAAAWVRKRRAAGYHRPTVYCSRSVIPAVRKATGSLVLGRDYDIWCADYTGTAHQVTSSVPGGVTAACAATQYKSTPGYDMSAVYDDGWPHRTAAAAAKPPAQASGADIWPAGVTLREGSTGSAVKALQYALRDGEFRVSATIGTVDGDFGPKTLLAVRVAQQILGLNVDGIAGPKTRSALVARGCLTAAGEGR